MRLITRLDRLAKWTYESVCRGKQFKAPAPGMNMHEVVYQEPQVFVGFYPSRDDTSPRSAPKTRTTAPSILLMPSVSYAQKAEEQGRSYPRGAAHIVGMQALFCVYEDGIRLPEYDLQFDPEKEALIDMNRVSEGTHDGVGLVLNWMEEYAEALTGAAMIPETDMSLIPETLFYGLYSESKTNNDTRPLFYGLMEMSFQCLEHKSAEHAKPYWDLIM